MRRYPRGKASMMSAAKWPVSIHVAVSGRSGRRKVGRRLGGAGNDDIDRGMGGRGISGGG